MYNRYALLTVFLRKAVKTLNTTVYHSQASSLTSTFCSKAVSKSTTAEEVLKKVRSRHEANGTLQG